MAREAFIKTWCDRHIRMTPPRKIEGENVHIQLGKNRGEIDLCEDCSRMLFAPILELTQLSIPSNTRSRTITKTTKAPCLICRKDVLLPFHHRHVWDLHSLNTSEIYGSTCPLCNRTLETYQGLGTHTKKAHEISGIPIAFEIAKSQGDPFGLYAKARVNAGLPSATED